MHVHTTKDTENNGSLSKQYGQRDYKRRKGDPIDISFQLVLHAF